MKIKGSALITVLIIITAFSAFLGILMVSSSQRVYSAEKLANRIRAKIYAEAGANEAFSILNTNFDLRTDSTKFPLITYGEGKYDAAVMPIGSDVAVIYSTGICNDATASVILDIKNFNKPIDGPDPDFDPGPVGAYCYAIVSGSTISIGGASDIVISGKIHTHSIFKLFGSASFAGDVESVVDIDIAKKLEIDGDASAPSFSGKGDVTGTKTIDSVVPVPIPEIDLTPYYIKALKHGEVYFGSKTISGDYSPAGGVMWVEGDLSISGGKLEGSFIATGDIHCSGGPVMEKVSSYPLLVSRDGSIHIAGHGSYHGLIYSRSPAGFIKITGSGTIIGTLICDGEFIKHGCSSVVSYEDSTPISPEGDSSDGDGYDRTGVGITAWQK